MLAMDRQRYEAWEVIAVTDGPCLKPDWMWSRRRGNLLWIETEKPLGHWGHPYRQLGIDAARGTYIGLQNDDNYLTPGFIEQLVFALEAGADVACCQVVHSYSGWDVTGPGSDLGSWLARTELVKRHLWKGQSFDYDLAYLKTLAAEGQCVEVPRPLVVHN